VFIQFWVTLQYNVTTLYQKYTCSEWVWLYGSRYALKCHCAIDRKLVPGIYMCPALD